MYLIGKNVELILSAHVLMGAEMISIRGEKLTGFDVVIGRRWLSFRDRKRFTGGFGFTEPTMVYEHSWYTEYTSVDSR